MKYILVYQEPELGQAWRKHFAPAQDVEIMEGDICAIDCDAIVSPANSFGFMDGGLDHAISERFGWSLQEQLQADIQKRPLKELLVGEAIIIATKDSRVPWLISAPTMRVPMRLRQTVNAYLAMKAILTSALAHPEINIITIPGLGTGCGHLSPETAALQMWTAYSEVVFGNTTYPADYGEAQRRHVNLNRDVINLWEP